MRVPHLIDPTELLAYEAGAQVLAALAYPGDEDELAREAARLALCGRFVRELKAGGDRLGIDVSEVIPLRYAFLDVDEIEAGSRDLERLLRDRLTAGHMAIAFLQEVAPDSRSKTPRDLGRRSLENVAAYVADQNGVDASNLIKRVWRPSFPVLHLACAWATRAQDAARAGSTPPDALEVIATWGNVAALLGTAEAYEPLIGTARATKNAATRLIRFRFARQGSVASLG